MNRICVLQRERRGLIWKSSTKYSSYYSRLAFQSDDSCVSNIVFFSFFLCSFCSLYEDQGWGKRKRNPIRHTECLLFSEQCFTDLLVRAGNLVTFHTKIYSLQVKNLLHLYLYRFYRLLRDSKVILPLIPDKHHNYIGCKSEDTTFCSKMSINCMEHRFHMTPRPFMLVCSCGCARGLDKVARL